MKNSNQKSILNSNGIKITAVDVIFGICTVFLFFSIFPLDYQYNAPSVFAMLSVVAYGIGKKFSKFLRTTLIEILNVNDNDWKRYFAYTHLPVIITYLYIIA